MKAQHTNILIADDEASIRTILEDILTLEGFQCLLARDGKEALEKIKSEPVDLVLLDLNLPRIKGIEVLKQAVELRPEIQFVIISAFGTIKMAVETTKLGAYDFIEKPLERERVLLTVNRALERQVLQLERDNLLRESRARYQMIGSDPTMLEVFSRIDRAAGVDSTVLLSGESGTGKELVARAIHFNSKRAAHPFVPVNCAAIPENLIESEFFGHVKGAFTGASADHRGKFQQAHGGTLFLDEIGEMSLMMQAKLLRALETKTIDPVGGKGAIPVDVRIVAATNRDLQQEIAEGNFRQDLYYRVSVIPLALSALRERKQDIPPLAEFFLEEVCKSQGLPAKSFSPNAWPLLKNHDWPGNVRELRNVVERAAVLGSDKLIDAAQIKAALQAGQANAVTPEPVATTLRHARAEFEREFIIQALAANHGKIQETANALGIQRGHLWKKMKLYDIEN